MANNELLKEYMDYRCSIYFWLKNLYISEPTCEILSDISNTCKDFGEDIESPDYEREFISFFKGLNDDDIEKLHKEIKAEYARLFLGPKRLPAPPYESVYRTCNKQIFGDSCFKVRKLYENAGMKINALGKIPDYFIGYELEFMYYLTFLTAQEIEKNNDEYVENLIKYQYKFLKEHLSVWIEKFTDRIAKNTEVKYFMVLSKFTKEFILEDYKCLEELK